MNLRRPLAKRALRSWFRRLPLRLETLESRDLPAVSPVSLADPTLWGVSGLKDSSQPSISADGQLIAFTSNADDLVANDNNGLADVFVYNRSTSTVTLVTTGITGAAGGGSGGVISPDGRYVIFASNSQQILPDFANDSESQLFLRDLQTGTTTLLSTTPGGAGGNRAAHGPSFSADSHFVIFVSVSNNLTPGFTFTGERDNLFRRDLTAGTTQLVSASLDGKSGGDGNTLNMSNRPEAAISANGRFIAFASSSGNLVANDGNGLEDVFLRDMVAGTTQLISTTPTGLTTANGHSHFYPGQSISADGRFVVFWSAATNLVSGPFSGGNPAYLRDTLTATTVAVSRDTLGTVRHGDGAVISPDGRYVAFVSTDKLIPVDVNGKNDVYVFDNTTGQLSLASVSMNSSSGGNANSGDNPATTGSRGGLVFSADSKVLAFASDATDLTTGVTTSGQDNVYLRNLAAGATKLVTSNAAGTDGGTGSSAFAPALSANGNFVALQSAAPNLVGGDTNRLADIFVRDVTAETTALASARTPLLPAAFTSKGGGTLGNVSADGRYVVFMSNVFFGVTFSDLAPNVTFTSGGGQSHIFVRDRQTGSIEVVDLNVAGTAAVGAHSPVISADGRYVAFFSTQTSLVSGITYTPSAGNIFIRDLQTDTTRLVSVDATGTHDAPVAGTVPHEIALSDDGRYVAYENTHVAPLPGVSNPSHFRTVLLRDMQSNKVWHVSHNVANDGAVGGNSRNISISSDGKYVLFGSDDTMIAANDANGAFAFDVFRWDRNTDTVDLVSVNDAGTATGNAASSGSFERPVMSTDGRYVAFSSNASDLVPGDTNGRTDVFLRDMQTKKTSTVSMNSAGIGGANNNSSAPSISADGSRIAFTSVATNLTGDKLNTTNNVYVRLLGGTPSTSLVSINAAGSGGGNNSSIAPLISPDGRYVAFLSHASDVAPNYVDGNGTGFLREDLFLRDLTLGATRAVNLHVAGTASSDAGQNGNPPNRVYFSGDSATLVFDASGSNLIAHDQYGNIDAFVTSTAGFSSIAGQVFGDTDMNGAKNGGEAGLQYWTVYIDANANSAFDFGEQYARTDAAGKYLLPNLTPGNYTVRVVPQAGYQLTTSPASHAVNIAADGTAITGKNFGEARPLPDLAVSSVASVQPTGSPGQKITVNWHVANNGQTAAAGSWRDAIYLSSTPTLTASSILLTTVEHNGGLASGAFYDGSVSIAVPPIAAGNYYVIVRADVRTQVFEGDLGANRTNNTSPSGATVAISVPSFGVGSPANGTFTGLGDGRYFQIAATPGQTLRIILNSIAASGSTELYVRRGDFPSLGNFDFASIVPNEPDQFVTVPTTAGGTYFVFVRAVGGPAAIDAFAVTASLPAYHVGSLSTTTGGNTGTVTVAVHGAQFSTSTWVELHRPPEGQALGQTLAAESVVYKDSTTFYATFDLTQALYAAPYILRVVDGSRAPGDQVAIAPMPFTVVDGQSTAVQVDVVVPDFVRFGRESYALVTYTNTSSNDVSAPILTMRADKATLSLHGSHNEPANEIQFLASSTTGPAGVLAPGYTGTLRIDFTSTTPLPNDTIHFQTELANNAASMNWAPHKASLRPDYIGVEAWDAVFGNFTAAVGTTVGSYIRALADNASYLSQLGVYTADVGRLLDFELSKANSVYTGSVIAGNTDVPAFPAPGLPLSLQRQFMQPIGGRYEDGPFGRGWVHDWQISAFADDGGVTVRRGGQYFHFHEDEIGGGGCGCNAELGRVVLVNGAYRLIEPDGTILVFMQNGQLDYKQDVAGNRITAAYTSARLIRLTHSDGDTIQIAYNAQNRISQITGPDGRVVTYNYDANGHLIDHTDRFGTTNYTYVMSSANPARQHALTHVAFPDATNIFYDYDARGRLIGQHRDGGEEQVAIVYGAGASYTVTDANDQALTIWLDDEGHRRRVTDPLGGLIEFEYDHDANPTATHLPMGATSRSSYDDVGNLIEGIDAAGNSVHFTYDSANHILSFEDALDRVTGLQPDAKGNVLAITAPDGAAERYEYDALGNITKMINRRGQATTLTYNARGLVTQVKLADNSTTNYTYNANSLVTSITDASGTITLTYDSRDYLASISYPDGRSFTFTNNIIGQRLQSVLHSPSLPDFTTNYHYDALGRLNKLTDGASALIVEYMFDDGGRIIREERGNGTATDYVYDAEGHVGSIIHKAPGGAENSRFDYAYDDLGRVTTMATGGDTTTYGYDILGQLTSVALPGGRTITYQYDAVGNRVSVVDTAVGTTGYTANSRNEYTQVGATSNTYDADGNITSQTGPGGTTTYAHNQLNQLTGITTPTDTWAYEYDAMGQRIAVTHNGVTTRYVIDPAGLGNVAAEYDGAGNLIANYMHGRGLVSQISSVGAAGYYDYDITGNTAGITDGVGGYVNRYSYLPFGETTTHSAGVSNPFTFVGAAGVMSDGPLTYMRARYYDLGTGAFVNDDPLGITAGDQNLRRYAGNSPTMYVDPSGLMTAAAKKLLDACARWAKGIANNERIIRSIIADHNTNAVFQDGHQIVEEHHFGYPGFGGIFLPFGDESRWFWAARQIEKYKNYREQLGCDCLEGNAKGDPPGSCSIDPTHGGHKPSNKSPKSPPPTNGTPGPDAASGSGRSFDPNDITGPAGFGDARFVATDDVMPYTIRFENDATKATLPAQDVVVTQRLDADLEWATFALVGFSFGSTTVDVPAGLRSFETRVDTTNLDGTALRVEIDASLNPDTGVVTWIFHSVDPATGGWPANAFAGFLPPNDDTHRGEGSVSYTIRPKAGSVSLTSIHAKASIVFDVNDPIETPLFTNIIDAGAPTGRVNDLPELSTGVNFTVSWVGQDNPNEAGVTSFDVYVSDDGGAWTLWLNSTSNTSAVFSAQEYHTYRFYALARDGVGNVEANVPGAEATIIATDGQFSRGDAYGADSGKTLLVQAAAGVLANDMKKPGRAYVAQLVAGPTHGTLALNPSGGFTYTPNGTYTGLDSFTYRTRDNAGHLGNVATVTLAAQLVSFRVDSQSVTESAGAASIWVDLRNAATQTTKIDYTVSARSATSGADFTLANGTLTFTAGQRSKAIPFAISNDALDELDETFSVKLSNPSNALLGKSTSTMITIVDNDAPPIVGFAKATMMSSEGVTSPAVEVRLSAASGKTVTVRYALTGGSAKKGTDFTLSGDTLTFAPGETLKVIPLAVISDRLHETDETVVLALAAATNAQLGRAGHTITIDDDDPPPLVNFATTASNVGEGDGFANLTVSLSAPSALPVTVKVLVTGGTATRDSDFRVLTWYLLTFAPGETTKTVKLAIIDDADHEGNETTLISLMSPTNAILGPAGSHTLTIFDND